MEGLCKEALTHGVKEAPEDGELKDIIIIGQYQRTSHYGITGFGSAAAIAKALGKKEHVSKLEGIVAEWRTSMAQMNLPVNERKSREIGRQASEGIGLAE
jgi:ferritin-like metal-binding protein YciE